MSSIEIVFLNPKNQRLSLFFSLRDIPIAQRWSKALEHNLARKCEILDRYIDLGRDRETVEQELRLAVSIINEYWPGMIQLEAKDPITQETLNRLHRHFEDMIGSVQEHRVFYRLAPEPVKKAIRDLNHRIHEIEALSKSTDAKGKNAQIYFELADVERFPLEDEDYGFFSLDVSYGDLFLHYTQLGKQFYDVFRDKDQSVSDGNIRPLRFVSGEFNAFFFDCNEETRRGELTEWLSHRGFDPKDPKNALGWLVVAHLDLKSPALIGLNRTEILELLSKYAKIETVRVLP